MTAVNRCVPVADVALEPSPLEKSQIVAGSPEVGSAVLHSTGGIERGVWQITPGIVTDIEVDELFVVVSGRATVEVLDPESGNVRDVLELVPGSVGLLATGTHTRWTVHETLRKVYQTTEA
ncbi:MAG TPA: cupin domain-containing protein [Micromonosporaceae bacterium]|nr:cupin domain-containing protein [Micromonosporaceae bacterium]